MIPASIIVGALIIGCGIYFGALAGLDGIADAIRTSIESHAWKTAEAIRTRRCGRGKVKFVYTVDGITRRESSRPKPPLIDRLRDN